MNIELSDLPLGTIWNEYHWRSALTQEEAIATMTAELDAISAAIGTTTYMDPPDGGSVSLAEQVARMARDAARYRWLREHSGEHQGPEVFIDGGYWIGTDQDEQIDRARS